MTCNVFSPNIGFQTATIADGTAIWADMNLAAGTELTLSTCLGAGKTLNVNQVTSQTLKGSVLLIKIFDRPYLPADF